VSVASNFLARTELKNREAYIDMMKYMHSNIKTWSERLKQELNRYYYVTPTSYIEFILSFKQLLS
jgi:dynein heavy chain